MLVGLTAQSLTVGPKITVVAFAIAALTFVALLVVASFTVTTVSATALRPIRMSGSAVKRFSGFVLIAVGAWFILLVFLPGPIIGA